MASTIWENQEDVDYELDLSKLESLFQLLPRRESPRTPKAVEKIHLIGAKRSHNIEIRLSRIPKTYEDIRKGYLSVDFSFFSEDEVNCLVCEYVALMNEPFEKNRNPSMVKSA